MVESTRLAAQMDPEDLRGLQRRFHEVCSDAVIRFGGYVGRYTGDGAMVYFGYPEAHEDDPERAIRAGLAVLANCRTINQRGEVPGIRIGVRVGIATGLVVAGDFGGNRAFDREDVVGIAPNLAYKLQAAAPRDALAISSTTRELTAGLFQCRTLPAITVAGLDGPQPVWQVVRARGRSVRSWGARLQSLTPLVSRDEEIAILMRRWSLAKAGNGQVVLISGEPGIGKSRIVASIKDRIAPDRHLVLTQHCSSLEIDTALHPVIRLFERMIGADAAAPDAIARRLAMFLGDPSIGVADLVPYLALLLRRGEAASLGQAADPEHLKQSILRTLVELVYRASCAHPVLLVCEDIHWIDPSSEELLGLLLERVHRMRVLVLATFRPSYQAPWIGLPFVTLLALNRLAPQQAALIVSYIARHRNVSQSAIDRIVSLADGIPLFLEELSRTAFSADLEPKKVVVSSDAEPAIPATLADSLTARLDQLGADREARKCVAQSVGHSTWVGEQTHRSGRAECRCRTRQVGIAGPCERAGRVRTPSTRSDMRLSESAYRSAAQQRQAVHQAGRHLHLELRARLYWSGDIGISLRTGGRGQRGDPVSTSCSPKCLGPFGQY
jgi:class 3 adenylate cyclase